MSGSVFGTIFRVSTWGESHGKAIGAVIDGCPAGLPLCEADIQPYLDRRKPGSGKYVTQRKEADEVQILSGIFDGKTTGTPISLLVYNTSQRSSDYTEIAQNYRPGHADYTFDEKYGFRDYRGGGRSSGRETTGRVAAGAIAIKILNRLGIDVCAYTRSIGGISDGSPALLRAHIKPTPSIFQPQQTIGRDHIERTLQIKGRHDPVIVPRAVVVVESMTALTILDLMLSNMGARMDHLEKIYTK